METISGAIKADIAYKALAVGFRLERFVVKGGKVSPLMNKSPL
jgi:hypothetical protein